MKMLQTMKYVRLKSRNRQIDRKRERVRKKRIIQFMVKINDVEKDRQSQFKIILNRFQRINENVFKIKYLSPCNTKKLEEII